MSIYAKICKDNIIKYGTEAKSVLTIIINQYSDRTHFIYEILQNAEDAGATKICFDLRKDKLCIYHNGRSFDEKDIRGVCGIAAGTKGDDGTRIGHFGIGFKSVYCYTEVPRIYSGQYCFEIKSHILPEEVASMPGLDVTTTCIVLPFDKEEVPKETAFSEIHDALVQKINAESILMLDNIAQVDISIEGEAKTKSITKEKYSFDNGQYKDNVFSISLHTTIRTGKLRDEKCRDVDYLFFTDANDEASAVVYRVEGKELKPIRNSKIYAFFPTAKEAHQNFYIHAPFDTTPARDNFKEGPEYGKHNIRLIKNVGELVWFSLTWMRDHGYLSAAGLNAVFPIYEYEEDDILRGLYENSIKIIREEAILPTNHANEFKMITDVCMPLWGNISETFDDEDLRLLLRDRNLSWLAKEFTTEAFVGFKNFLRSNFDIRILEWKNLVLQMDAAFLKRKSMAWIEGMMVRIESYCIKKPDRDSHFIDVTGIPLVRTTRGEQICAKDGNGRALVYLNNSDAADYKIDVQFLKNDTIRGFYQRVLGIVEYNIEQEVVGRVLPKYASRNVRFVTQNHFDENIHDLKLVKDAIYANPRVLESVRECYILTDGQRWYRPEELYIPSDDIRSGYALLKGEASKKYLSDDYRTGSFSTMRLDDDFFRSLGCSDGLRTIKVGREDYLKMVHHYLGKNEEMELRRKIFSKKYISPKLAWETNFEGFPGVFLDMDKGKSVAIARFLNSWVMDFDIQGDLVSANDRNYAGNNVDSRMVYSMIGLQLCFEKWIYIEGDDNPHIPSDVDREDLIAEYKYAKRLMDMLPFKDTKNALTEWLEENIKDKSKVAMIKRYMSSPEDLAKYAEAKAKDEARENARKKKHGSLEDILAGNDRKQRGDSSGGEDFEVTPISQKGMDKRSESLEKELKESLDYKTAVTKGVSFTSRKSNKQEKQFLEQEYGGACQICGTRIRKYDGKSYFEAINVMKYSELPKELENSSYTGWNSLSLCPNCAAKYNYCSKIISGFYGQVMGQDVKADSEDPINIGIEMPEGEQKAIRYSPRHFMVLKEAFKLFEHME